MSVYRPPQEYIKRKLAATLPHSRPRVRLENDLAALLTGPTSGGKADDLIKRLLDVNQADEVAQALREISDRYWAEKARR